MNFMLKPFSILNKQMRGSFQKKIGWINPLAVPLRWETNKYQILP
jgi:hypothetical protein